MKYPLFSAAFALLALAPAWAADKKPPAKGEASDPDVAIAGTLGLTPDEIKDELGILIRENFVVVHVRVTPKTGDPLRISIDDFTLISRKDGDRSPALSPYQIAGRSALVVKTVQTQTVIGTERTGPVYGGVGTGMPRRLPGQGGSIGSGPGGGTGVEASVDDNKKAPENPILPVLKAKVLPDQESREPVEGLLYFIIEGKLKPKDVSLLYKGPKSRLVIDFKQ